MRRKFWSILFSVVILIGMTSNPMKSWFNSSVSAQSSQVEFSLEPMNIEKLNSILKEQINNISTKPGQWQFSINEIPIIVLADVKADRMRIIAPIISVQKLTQEQSQKMMLANFHTALDARYAIANGQVVSTFIHPLSSLQERDLLSALNQVSSLTVTFGKNYSSGELLFVPRGGAEKQPLPEQFSEDTISAIPLDSE